MRSLRLAAPASTLALSLLAFPVLGGPSDPTGVPNFHQVNEHVFRGGQPSDQGWASLAHLGVRTVIDLRREEEHSTAAEAQAVRAAGMRYVNVPMNGFDVPHPDQIAQVLGLLDAGDSVFVHCKLGKDRTGTVIAAYRMAHDHWSPVQAIGEAETCGLHWYERGMKRFIRGYPPEGASTTTTVERVAVQH